MPPEDDFGTRTGLASGPGRRLAAIMFSDVVGYTAMTQSNESLALEVLEEHRALLRPIFAARNGQEVKTMGDAFLVEFKSALDAVNCAIEMQQALARRNAEQTSLRRVEIRVGIHAGDVVQIGEDVYGDTVNIASRIERLAEPGGICVSDQVYEQVRNKIDFPMTKMGEHHLRNVDVPVPVYSVSPVWAGVARAERAGPARRLAVMPLQNIGSGTDDEYLADGLTEELISDLSGVAGLKVIARTSVMRYKGTTKAISEIGRELNASTVLEGSVRRSANRLRVTVKLVEAESEECLWTESYDRGLEDVIAVQEDIGRRVARALKTRVAADGDEDEEERRGGRARKITEVPEAFLLYLKGRYHLTRHTEAEVREATALFEQAVQKDPGFASAHAMLAQCFLFQGFFGLVPPAEAFARARPPLKHALELDPDLDAAHMLMGRLLVDQDWDWSGAEAEFRRAIELSPNSAEAHYRYALLLNDTGRSDQAVAEVLAAEDLDPLSVAVNQVAGTVLYYNGRYGEAIERLRRALEIDPRAALPRVNLGLALFHQGEVSEGIREVKSVVDLDPRNAMFRADLCYLYGRAGMEEEARGILAQTEEAAKTEHISPVAVAGMCSCLGEVDRAMEWLERAFAERSPYLTSLRVERWFDGMRSDPRFRALLARIGLPPDGGRPLERRPPT